MPAPGLAKHGDLLILDLLVVFGLTVGVCLTRPLTQWSTLFSPRLSHSLLLEERDFF